MTPIENPTPGAQTTSRVASRGSRGRKAVTIHPLHYVSTHLLLHGPAPAIQPADDCFSHYCPRPTKDSGDCFYLPGFVLFAAKGGRA